MALPTLSYLAAALGGAYLDARLGISNDLRQIWHDRSWQIRFGQRVAGLGNTCTLYAMLERVDPELDALWFEGRTWSYGELKSDVDKLAAILREANIGSGDFVALFTTNSPEMIVACLALSKLGAISAMINTNLRDDTFRHCVKVSKACYIISTPDLAPFVEGELPHISLCLYSFENISLPSDSALVTFLRKKSPRWLTTPVDNKPPAPRSIQDFALLIFTSGTTGKPKACAIRNLLTIITSTPITVDVLNPRKYYPLRTYSALPLFHGTAFFSGICYSLGNSGCLCIRRKFSATNFWKDIHDSRATRALYIGELCRYVLSTPAGKYDTDHRCIVAHGNGMRGDIWLEFKRRFNVPEIREFYRSTEGVSKFDNFNHGTFGAGCVGFQGAIMRLWEDGTYIVKYDQETEQPWRDPKTGFCRKAKTGEAGEAIGRIRDRALLTEYLGNDKATEEKLLRDVFKKGDLFQRMGDLLIRDRDGWIRFADRIGDTFRWKGENVSAGEVRDHICRASEVEDAIVYGVKLRSYDGQAGAAAISLTTKDETTETKLMQKLPAFLISKGIPNYAIPRLVRITESISTGVTYKQAKSGVASRSWFPSAERDDNDSLYWLSGSSYQKLDDKAWSEIDKGLAKL